MQEKLLENLLNKAIDNMTADPDDFNEGYCRGLLQLYHGEDYGNKNEIKERSSSSSQFKEGFQAGLEADKKNS